VAALIALMTLLIAPVNAYANAGRCHSTPYGDGSDCMFVYGSGTYIDHIQVRVHVAWGLTWKGSAEMWVQKWGQDTDPFKIVSGYDNNSQYDWIYNWTLKASYPSASGHQTEVCAAFSTNSGYFEIPVGPDCVYSPW